MKKVVLYIFSVLLMCSYMATNMGFGVHTCTMDGTSKVMLPAGEDMCNHEHSNAHEADHEHKECSCDKHDNHCCYTLVYILDKAHHMAYNVKIEVPAVVCDGAFLSTTEEFRTLFDETVVALHAVDIARGPGGGLFAFAPLRL